MYDRVVMVSPLSDSKRPSRTVLSLLIGTPALVLLCLSGARADSTTPRTPVVRGRPLQVALETIERRGDGYVAALEGGGVAELTLDPVFQSEAERILDTHKVPFGAAVVISIADGKVLAMAGRAAAAPQLGAKELALRPWAPAASVFKLVSAAALVEESGLKRDARACYHGGVSSVQPENLKDIAKLDTRCDTLDYAIGKSQNAIIAKLATKHLEPEALAKVARAFAFGERLPFEAPVEASSFEAPTDPLEFARAAAGFWHSSLSVMHGALIAAALGNGGLMPAPRIIAKAVDDEGRVLPLPRRRVRRVVAPETALEVGRMMEATTRMGTAKSAFRGPNGQPLLPVDVAGKTGTLNYRGGETDPRLPAAWPQGEPLGYSWFVGYAPADKPQFAFAVLLGNQATWRIKAPFVAQRLVSEHLAATGLTGKVRSVAAAANRSSKSAATR